MKKQRIKQTKALVLFSGGLDSRLVVKLLQEQGIKLEALYFNLPFGCGCCNNLECNFNFSQLNNLKIRMIDCNRGRFFHNYIKIIRNPKYGRGRGLNPCIHCRIFMLNEAKRIMQKEKFDFIATGEVLGQRPMSQYRHALLSIEKETKLQGRILRPLSAKLLPETIVEKNKLVDRNKLLNINGRNRRVQIELANKFRIKYPNPAGGCLLCDKNYSKKLLDLLNNSKTIKPEEIFSLNNFRHFRLRGKLILGRNKEENEELFRLNKKLKFNIIIPKLPGPTCIFESKGDKKLAEELIEAYSSKNLDLRKNFKNIRI